MSQLTGKLRIKWPESYDPQKVLSDRFNLDKDNLVYNGVEGLIAHACVLKDKGLIEDFWVEEKTPPGQGEVIDGYLRGQGC
jgi:hypothetical protein